MFNNCHYNAWYKYCIAHTLTSDYSIHEDTAKSLVKEFGKKIFLVGVYVKKLRKSISIVVSIWRVRRDMAKHLERYVHI